MNKTPYISGTQVGDRIYLAGTAFRVHAINTSTCEMCIFELEPTYSPLPAMLTVKQTKENGLGLFATSIIERHVKLGIGWYVNKSAIDSLHKPSSPAIGKIRTPLGGFINHSSTPNCEVVHRVVWLPASGIACDHWLLYTTQCVGPCIELVIDYDAPVKMVPNATL